MAIDVNSMGALRSKINLSLHTYHATRLWWGRGVESGKPQIIGMRQFLFLVGAIQRNAARDDPYADHWMLMIDDKLEEVRGKLDAAFTDAERLLEQIPSELTIEENVNQRPFMTPVYTGGQQGWLALRLLIDFDRLVRNILLASHVALISRDAAHDQLRTINRELRSLCAFPQRYPGYSGITRDDVAANNAKAREAREKFGELPQDVLDGSRRSPYAPPIQKQQPAAATENEPEPEVDLDQGSEEESPASGSEGGESDQEVSASGDSVTKEA